MGVLPFKSDELSFMNKEAATKIRFKLTDIPRDRNA
jgi:hypothetical protein